MLLSFIFPLKVSYSLLRTDNSYYRKKNKNSGLESNTQYIHTRNVRSGQVLHFSLGLVPKTHVQRTTSVYKLIGKFTALKDVTTPAFQNLQEIWKSCFFIYDTKFNCII